MNNPLPKALKTNFYAVFGSRASQKLHNINLLVPSAVIEVFGCPKSTF
jgi:hypothetical protein